MPRIRRKNIDEQLWARVDRRGDDECWMYIGQLNKTRDQGIVGTYLRVGATVRRILRDH